MAPTSQRLSKRSWETVPFTRNRPDASKPAAPIMAAAPFSKFASSQMKTIATDINVHDNTLGLSLSLTPLLCLLDAIGVANPSFRSRYGVFGA